MNSAINESVNVYTDTKAEYTRQLCQILTTPFHKYFLDLRKQLKETNPDVRQFPWEFQAFCEAVPNWSQEKVVSETDKIVQEASCDYLEELLTAVFIAHTKVLSAIRINTKQKKLQLTIPKLDHFLHRTFRVVGRLLWSHIYLFLEEGTKVEQQKNIIQMGNLVQEGIQQSIRELLPVKSILKEYMNDEEEEETAATAAVATAAVPSLSTSVTSLTLPIPGEDLSGNAISIVAAPVVAAAAALTPVAPAATVVLESPPAAASTTVPSSAPPDPQSVAPTPAIPVVPATPAAPVPEPMKLATVPPVLPVPAPVPVPAQTFTVDTEPTVSFTNMDTIFDSENPDANEIVASPLYNEDEDEIDHIRIVENEPATALDEYEDLEGKSGIEFDEEISA